MSLPGYGLAGRAGEELVHDGKIIASPSRECIKESLWLLIDPYIIHVQELWQHSGFIGIARPATADRQIEDDEKRVVEDPLIGDVSRGDLEIFLIVKIPADLVFLPLDGKHMKIIPQ